MCLGEVNEKSTQNFSSISLELIKSQWVSVSLIVSGLAILTIAILASTGQFCGISVTNANYLAYATYATSALCFVIFMIKSLLLSRLRKETPLTPRGEK